MADQQIAGVYQKTVRQVRTKGRKLLLRVAGESSFERNIHLFLAFFRFVGLMAAISTLINTSDEKLEEPGMLAVIISVSLYTALKILVRFRLWQRNILTYAILVGDLAVCIAIILVTGGSDSPFIFYSLMPVITASLFFERRISLFIAAMSSLGLIIGHIMPAEIDPGFTPVAGSNPSGFVVAYSLFCFLIATITYPSNLNVYRHIQSKAIAEERRRLRQEIHDGIAQVMGYLRTKMELLKKDLPGEYAELAARLDEIYDPVVESYTDIREAIDSLDVKADSISLQSAIDGYLRRYSKRTGAKTTFNVSKELPDLHPLTKLQLLRIVQEALNNVRKHSLATEIKIEMQNTPQGMELLVSDNGKGFLPSEQGKGAGLKIMEERAGSINSALTVNSSPGEGTEIRVKIPRR